jgi:Spy/CpxP family protein refolding chaperone
VTAATHDAAEEVAKMIRKSRTLTLAGALLLVGATLASAAGARGFGGPGHHARGFRGGPGACDAFGGPGPLGRALHRLDLSTEQRDRIEALVDAHRDATESLRAEMRDGFRDRLAGDLETEFDESAVRARAEQRAEAMIEMEVSRAKLHADVLAVLTPEQRAELAEMKARFAERVERFGERRGWDDDAE